MRNLPTDLLRTFVTVADMGGFTSAGEALGRSQPAVSLQLKRLEDLVGTILLRREGRELDLSEAGQLLYDYAQRILALNDEVCSRLSQPEIEGVVRLGLPNEYAHSFLPVVLGTFTQSHPNVTLEVGCDLSVNLLAAHRRGEFDLVFALHKDAAPSKLTAVWQEEIVWVGASPHQVYKARPLPLIVEPKGSVYRERLAQVLDADGIESRVAYTTPSFGAIKAGVMAGLGVTALPRSTVPEGLRILGTAEGLPVLGQVELALHYHKTKASEALLRLVDHVTTGINYTAHRRQRTA